MNLFIKYISKNTLIFLLFAILFSCTKRDVENVDCTINNFNIITNSKSYTIDIVGGYGHFAGFSTFKDQIKINKLNYQLVTQNKFKKLTNIERDSFQNLLKNIFKDNDIHKTLLESGGCSSFDANYTINNGIIQILIKPKRIIESRDNLNRIINFHNSDYKTMGEIIDSFNLN